MFIEKPHLDGHVAVFYLARGADEDFYGKVYRFMESYKEYDGGIIHDFYIIYKGFKNNSDLNPALQLTKAIKHTGFFFPDDGFDIEAYYRASVRVPHRFVFFMNTSSILNGSDWLLKLLLNLKRPGVGLVGTTASYEGAVGGALQFPNLHVRTNAFMMSRSDFLKTRHGGLLATKLDAYELEHGSTSITAQCLMSRRSALVVGKDGRGYPPYLWPISDTFRQGNQENLLVCDGQTETFASAPLPFKRQLFNLAWGDGALIEGLKIWNPRTDCVNGDGE